MPCRSQVGGEGSERNHLGQRLVAQRHSAVIGVTPGCAVVLCIDNEHNAPNLSRGTQAAPRCRGKELAAETFPCKRTSVAMRASRNQAHRAGRGRGEPSPACQRKPERPEPGCRTQGWSYFRRYQLQERFSRHGFMALAGVALQKVIRGCLATVKGLPGAFSSSALRARLEDSPAFPRRLRHCRDCCPQLGIQRRPLFRAGSA